MSRHTSPADWFWMMHFDNPPTTAEWLAWCKMRGIGKTYLKRGVWHRPYRPFISPNIYPWGQFTGGGYRSWRGKKLP